MGHKFTEKISSFLFEYDTPRMVLVHNKKVGLTFRLIQLVVLTYIIGWVFLYEKGYQSKDGIINSVSVKLKGIAVTNISGMGPYLWDVADYVFPPQGDSSFVVMTNFIITRGQKQETCPGVCSSACFILVSKAIFIHFLTILFSGIMTGKCVDFSHTQKTCEIFGWCPVEIDDNIPNPPLLLEAGKFTLFIKNSITFPKFGVSRRNLVEQISERYLKKCVYHKDKDPLCPVFKLGYMVEESGQNFSQVGGIVGITINWDCDFDWPLKYCVPVYKFHRLYSENSNVSPGYNFRYARYYRENGRDMRILYKVFGIRFDILVNGKAGKFDIIPTMTTIGSGIGIFGVVNLKILLTVHKTSKTFENLA
uniref:P2X purinoceptor n=1 Tax=Pseudonaja textilis TaxID=8673 RepID=A0A670XZZ9_PSETE